MQFHIYYRCLVLHPSSLASPRIYANHWQTSGVPWWLKQFEVRNSGCHESSQLPFLYVFSFQVEHHCFLDLPTSRWGLEFWNYNWSPEIRSTPLEERWILWHNILGELSALLRLCHPQALPLSQVRASNPLLPFAWLFPLPSYICMEYVISSCRWINSFRSTPERMKHRDIVFMLWIISALAPSWRYCGFFRVYYDGLCCPFLMIIQKWNIEALLT